MCIRDRDGGNRACGDSGSGDVGVCVGGGGGGGVVVGRSSFDIYHEWGGKVDVEPQEFMRC